MTMLRFAQAFIACVLVLPASNLFAEEKDVGGTKRGPTGWYLTRQQREALRERVKNEPWAREFFEKNVLLGNAALAYAVTGEQKHAEAAKAQLMRAVQHWERRPADFDTKNPTYHGWVGNSAWGVNTALVGRVDMHVLYDLAAEALTDDEDRAVRQTIKDVVDYSLAWIRGHGGNPNMNFIAHTSFYEWAASIGYEQAMTWLLEHRKPESNHGGILEMLENYMEDFEISRESPIYQTISLRVIDLAACAYRYDGRDLFSYRSPRGNTLKAMLDGLINTSYPIMKTGVYGGTPCPANWGHGGTMYLGDIAIVNRPSSEFTGYNAEGAIASLLRVYPDDVNYRWLMSITSRATSRQTGELASPPTMDDFLYGRLPITDSEPVAPAPCRLYPNAGVAMLRFPETGDYWHNGIAAWFHGGEPSRGHIGDPSLMLFGAGRLLFPQFLTTQYEDQITTGWSMRRISRNTVTIDGKDGAPFATTWRHAFEPEVKYVSLRGRPYKEAELERIGMLTGEYLLDIVSARVTGEPEGGGQFPHGTQFYDDSLQTDASANPQERRYTGMPKQHTFDYTLHGLGRMYPDVWQLYQPSDTFTHSAWPNRWARNERSRQTDGNFHVDWIQTWANYRRGLTPGEQRGWEKLGEEWFASRAGVRTRMLGDADTTVFLAEGPMRWGPVDDDITPEEVIPFLAVRRTGKEALFVALHEPYRDAPAIQRFFWLHKPRKQAGRNAAAVVVMGPDYVDRLVAPLGLPGQTGSRLNADATKSQRKAGDLPLSVVTSDGDPGEGVACRGQAYLRRQGKTLLARGAMESFSVNAPGVNALLLNGEKVPFQRKDDYVIYGTGQWQPAGKRPVAPVPAEPAIPPLAASLPQQYVNVDAEKGGELIVRVQNVSGVTFPGSTASGRIAVEAGGNVKVEPAAVDVPALAPGEHGDFRFIVSGGANGAIAPVTVRMFVREGEQEELAHVVRSSVSVGVSIEEIVQDYARPMYKDYGESRFTTLSDQNESFTRFRVRAPGYTIEVDKFSGTCRSTIDPDGKERMAAGWYPFRFTRGYATMSYDLRGTTKYPGRTPYELPCAKNADGEKVLAWWLGAKLAENGRDAGTNLPVLRFQTVDGRYELRYDFAPEAVSVKFTPLTDAAAPLDLIMDALCVEHPTYRYRPLIEPTRFGFREGPYVLPPDAKPNAYYPFGYFSFTTYPRMGK